jgi:hypothetical protein
MGMVQGLAVGLCDLGMGTAGLVLNTPVTGVLVYLSHRELRPLS